MIVEPLTEKFWNDSLAAFKSSWEGRDLGDSALHETCCRIVDPLACSVLVDLVKHSGVQCPPDAEIIGFQRYLGAHLTMYSGPVLQHINFGVYLDKWFVETLLPYIDSIPHVTERFWDDISVICHTATTRFDENEGIPVFAAEQQRFQRAGRSIQYRLVRNFILRRSAPDSQSDDIGVLSSHVGIDEPYGSGIAILRKVFKMYCRVVAQLYRPAHQKRRRNIKPCK